jgi:cobalamin biosynthesis protein CobD/CbiB
MPEIRGKASFSNEQLDEIEKAAKKVLVDNQSKRNAQVVWGCFIVGVAIVVVTLIRLFFIEDTNFSDFVPLFIGAALCVVSLVRKIVIRPGEVIIERLAREIIKYLGE